MDPSFVGNVFIATESTTGTLAGGTSLTVSDITTGVDESQDASFYIAAITLDSSENPKNGACAGSKSASNAVVAPPFVAPSATATRCGLRGPSNYDASLTITASIGVFVPEGDIITI